MNSYYSTRPPLPQNVDLYSIVSTDSQFQYCALPPAICHRKDCCTESILRPACASSPASALPLTNDSPRDLYTSTSSSIPSGKISMVHVALLREVYKIPPGPRNSYVKDHNGSCHMSKYRVSYQDLQKMVKLAICHIHYTAPTLSRLPPPYLYSLFPYPPFLFPFPCLSLSLISESASKLYLSLLSLLYYFGLVLLVRIFWPRNYW
mmetsp:Transcript_28761/g.48259  ORF Transcript_28761/g.48259 Transcript_28761/m.48259 type:complete len:206 (+) Transcript_28761:557-1174(+)